VPEDVMNVINIEKPKGVVVAFGGQTAIKLAKTLAKNNVPIIGTSRRQHRCREDRERFDELLERCNIKRPKGHTVMTTEEALAPHTTRLPGAACVPPTCSAART
jgi:carbamoyl-phosphate synthase large subunit